MKTRLTATLLMLLLVTALLVAGCAQAATSDAGVKPGNIANLQTGAANSDTTPNKTTIPKSNGNDSSAGVTVMDSSPRLTKISDILQNPKNYSGKIVVVEGRIVNECGSGCWFTLKDSSAVIYIDLAPNNMVIPQKRGSNARVTGEVVYTGSDTYLIGSKVDL